MRTTLDIDDDVLAAAKELARARRTTAGQVISDLARASLTTRARRGSLRVRNGFPVLPKTGAVLTTEMVDRLAEDEL
jgi:hypothetical protein